MAKKKRHAFGVVHELSSPIQNENWLRISFHGAANCVPNYQLFLFTLFGCDLMMWNDKMPCHLVTRARPNPHGKFIEILIDTEELQAF